MFAIKQLSTGYFLAGFGKNQSKGGTWLEPRPDCLPRLFHKRHHAKVALDNWLKGRLTYLRSYEPFGEDDGRLEFEPVPERKSEDMVIVEVQIVEKYL